MRHLRVVLLAVVLPSIIALAAPPAAARPTVHARHWVIMDADTGEVLDGQAAHARSAMASLTKVLTALVAIERGDLAQTVTVVRSDLLGGATAGLRAGETVSLRTLLYGLLLPSGNDAAMAIARAVGGSPATDDPAARERFVTWMNERVASMGLTDTHVVNPHGLDAPGHFSSAHDLAEITRAALASPTFVAIVGAAAYAADGHRYESTNELPRRYPGVTGGKTGWTEDAGHCLIEVAERAGRRLIVVLLGSDGEHWYDDAAALLDYGWSLPSPATTPERAARVFAWWRDRTDRPVSDGLVQRSWVWGPEPNGAPRYEPYDDAPGGQRLVQYFDKGRMEVTDPAAPLTGGWYVTGGRLAWEMIAGQRQVGSSRFEPLPPATVPLAGDPDGGSPSYATLTPLLGATPAPAGSPVIDRLSADGSVVDEPALAVHGVTAGAPEPATGHGIASVFAAFLAQRGPVVVDGRVEDSPLFDPPVAVTGYPITEAYWVRAPVGGVPRDVLVQCFERRCLTYTPDNPPGWRVEMGNIGRAYQAWLDHSLAPASADGAGLAIPLAALVALAHGPATDTRHPW
ncbi:MAG: hypothetical protein QJR03_12680 [Sphaerobacter sp.]|nr:hypothetical protein [Sphaerobacter sp.]MDI3341377.1 hypothetical protein [Sphaerobacter sp.]